MNHAGPGLSSDAQSLAWRGLARFAARATRFGAAGALACLLFSACSHSGAPPALGDSISVEQPGGGVTQLIASGTQLPSSATESFTTTTDSQKKLYVHVLRGAAKKAGKLSSDGWWSIDGVPDAPAGQARVFVTFEVDAKADLAMTARQEAFKLKVTKLERAPEDAKPAPLTEPDDEDEGPDEAE